MNPSLPSLLSLLAALLCPGPELDPPLSDLLRFRPCAMECVRFSEDVEKHVEMDSIIYPWRRQQDNETRTQLRQMRRPWELLEDAQLERWTYNYDVPSGEWTSVPCGLEDRRRSLGLLRELLGQEEYSAGRMPSCVPVWRFRAID